MAKIKINSRYGITPNELLNNKEVTLKAKGLYAYIQSKSDDWDFSAEKIAIQSKESIDAIKTGLRELESAGYLQRVKVHNEKGYFEIEYILYEKPIQVIPTKDIPMVDFPTLDNGTNNSNKDLSKKDIKNKDLEKEISKEILTTDLENEKLRLEIKILKQALEEEKKKKEERKSSGKKKENEPPSQAEFMEYAKEVIEGDLKQSFANYEFVVFSKYETWVSDGWKDGNKKPILNWKSKFKNTLPYLKPLSNGISISNHAKPIGVSQGNGYANFNGEEGKSANRVIPIGERPSISKHGR